jgi:gamma-glutamyl:cysteine ligase YbdK (ATP-grasp superfamily)
LELRCGETLIADLLDRVADDAAALWCEWALERVEAIAAEGTSADRLLRQVRQVTVSPTSCAGWSRKPSAPERPRGG